MKKTDSNNTKQKVLRKNDSDAQSPYTLGAHTEKVDMIK